jgi:hypothetical protein
MRAAGAPAEVVALAAIPASDGASSFTGQTIPVDGGMTGAICRWPTRTDQCRAVSLARRNRRHPPMNCSSLRNLFPDSMDVPPAANRLTVITTASSGASSLIGFHL